MVISNHNNETGLGIQMTSSLDTSVDTSDGKMVHGAEVERNNRACRHCNENLLHLAVACSKSLPSVSYWKGTQQLEKKTAAEKGQATTTPSGRS